MQNFYNFLNSITDNIVIINYKLFYDIYKNSSAQNNFKNTHKSFFVSSIREHLHKILFFLEDNNMYIIENIELVVERKLKTFDIKVGFIDKSKNQLYLNIIDKRHLEYINLLNDNIKNFPEPILFLDYNDSLDIYYANDVFYENINLNPSQVNALFSNSFSNFFNPEFKNSYMHSIFNQISKYNSFKIEIKILIKHISHTIYFCGILDKIRNQLICSTNCIDEKIAIFEELMLKQSILLTLSDMNSDILFKFDIINDKIEFIGDVFSKFGFGNYMRYFEQSFLESGIIFAQDVNKFVNMLHNMKSGIEYPTTFRLFSRDGEINWYEIRYKLYSNHKSVVQKAIGVITNIQKQIELEKQLDIDPLTSCLTRTKFEQLINQTLSLSTKQSHTLLILDIDNFKSINDTFGHTTGDFVLKEVGDDLTTIFRDSDIVGRIGGDEFMVFIPHLSSREIVIKKCESVLKLLKKTYTKNGVPVSISASIGVAFYYDDSDTFAKLYNSADTALYHSKRIGKNNFTFFDDIIGK